MPKWENAFYVDNCVISVSDEKKLLQFVQEAKQILVSSCFDLHGWEYIALTGDKKEEISLVHGLL